MQTFFWNLTKPRYFLQLWLLNFGEIISRWSMIVRMSVVLRGTVCDDIDWRLDNLSGSHHQSQVNCESPVDVMSLVVVLIGRRLTKLLVVCLLSRDVIGCEDCKTWLVLFDPSYVSQISVGLLLVKLVGLSFVCLVGVIHKSFVRYRQLLVTVQWSLF